MIKAVSRSAINIFSLLDLLHFVARLNSVVIKLVLQHEYLIIKKLPAQMKWGKSSIGLYARMYLSEEFKSKAPPNIKYRMGPIFKFIYQA